MADTGGGGEPVPVSVMMLDIRQGRSAEMRMAVAKALCAHCVEILGLSEDRLNVEFTQHSGDEMYTRPSGATARVVGGRALTRRVRFWR